MASQTLPAQAKQLFRYLFEQASLGIAVEDIDGTLLLANPALCSMLGYQENELCGMSCSQFASPEDSKDDWALFQQLRAGVVDQYSLEKRYVRKDGTPLWGRLNVSLLKDGDGGSPLVFAFVEDITERRRTEQALRESEQQLHLAVQAGKMYAFDWDTQTDVIVRSGECKHIVNWTVDPHHDTGRNFCARVHPDDHDLYAAAEAGLKPEDPDYQIRFRVLRPDGSVIWLEDTGRASFDSQGRMLKVLGMVADITERKRAEEALSSMTHKLIEAQERERARIARDLHDDVGQRLALLANQLEQLRQDSPGLPADVRGRLGEMYEQSCEIATGVQSLSHELHSAKLQYLGIAAAMRGFCREFADQQKLEIDFKIHDLPSPASPDISLCLFRVLQEALHNSAKHSGVRHIEVQLWGTPDEIHLAVRDSGVGFDNEAAKESRGLGLVSMDERLKLVNGVLSIESQPMRGTTIHARVPVSRSDSMLAAG
jgi:PAS domain S-box-containing protein